MFIDLSTNSPATAKRVHEGMQAKGIAMLEAPVSGGTARATDGTIVIMVGGDAAVFEQNLPLLKSFSGEVIHVGEIGYGSTAKLINNMLAFCNAAAAAEALMIGKRSGIDLRKLDAVIRNASGMSAGYANLSSKTLAGRLQGDVRPGSRPQGPAAGVGDGGRTGGSRTDRAAGHEPDADGARHGPGVIGFGGGGPGLRNRAGRGRPRLTGTMRPCRSAPIGGTLGRVPAAQQNQVASASTRHC